MKTLQNTYILPIYNSWIFQCKHANKNIWINNIATCHETISFKLIFFSIYHDFQHTTISDMDKNQHNNLILDWQKLMGQIISLYTLHINYQTLFVNLSIQIIKCIIILLWQGKKMVGPYVPKSCSSHVIVHYCELIFEELIIRCCYELLLWVFFLGTLFAECNCEQGVHFLGTFFTRCCCELGVQFLGTSWNRSGRQ
jgi:hypothetical protein